MRRLLPRAGLLHQAPAVRTPETHAARPLDDQARRSFEQSFGWDFSRVRVHADVAAVPAAGARAITVGEDIFFGPEQYAPGRLETRRLLAHELTHVVQQARGAAAGRWPRRAERPRPRRRAWPCRPPSEHR